MFEASEALQKMEDMKKKSLSFHQYSWNSEVETTWISLIGWHHKTSSTYSPRTLLLISRTIVFFMSSGMIFWDEKIFLFQLANWEKYRNRRSLNIRSTWKKTRVLSHFDIVDKIFHWSHLKISCVLSGFQFFNFFDIFSPFLLIFQDNKLGKISMSAQLTGIELEKLKIGNFQ